MCAACQDVGDGCGDGGLAVPVEQRHRARGEAADVAPGVHPAREEGVDARHSGAQPVLPLRGARAALELDESLAVRGEFYDSSPPPTPRVACHLHVTLQHAHDGVVGGQREGAGLVLGRPSPRAEPCARVPRRPVGLWCL